MDRPELYESTYFDSVTVINHFSRQVGWEVIGQVIGDAEKGEVVIYGSPLLMVEAIGQPLNRTGYDPALEARVGTFLFDSTVTPVEFDLVVAERAREIVLDYRLRTNDAIHVASALVAGAETFFTYDDGVITNLASLPDLWVGEPFRRSTPTQANVWGVGMFNPEDGAPF